MSTLSEKIQETLNAVEKTPVEDVRTVRFVNGNTARLTHVPRFADPIGIIKKLGLGKPQAMIMNIGGASGLEDRLKDRLVQLYSRAIAKAAAETDALIIDGGTESGVMQMMGQGVADRGRVSRLIGVSPESKVSYPDGPDTSQNTDVSPLEPNHTHFVLVEGDDWGCETETMWTLAKCLAKEDFMKDDEVKKPVEPVVKEPVKKSLLDRIIKRQKASSAANTPPPSNISKGHVPAVTILVNGGAIATQEVLNSVRLGWPVIILAGSGRLADRIIDNYYNRDPNEIDDPALAEIISDGQLHPYPIDGPVDGIGRLIKRLLREDATLRTAWEMFALYDFNANRQGKEFNILQNTILTMGVVATFLALLKKTLHDDVLVTMLKWFFGWFHKIVPFWELDSDQIIYISQLFFEIFDQSLYYVIVLFPIVIATLIAAANQFSSGNKWIFLRSSAETIKRHIYRYRTRADVFGPEQIGDVTREAKLAEKVKFIRSQLNQTEVNLSALIPYKGPVPPKYGAAEGDDGFSPLTPEKYVAFRLEDQLKYYSSKTVKIEKQLKKYQWYIYIMSGVGTLLAAMEWEWWIALTTCMVASLTTYMEYQQLENKLIQFNQGATDLANVKSWWMALSAEEQANLKYIDMLVMQTERILETENSSWMSDMQDAIEQLKATQDSAGQDAKEKKKGERPSPEFELPTVASVKTRYTRKQEEAPETEAPAPPKKNRRKAAGTGKRTPSIQAKKSAQPESPDVAPAPDESAAEDIVGEE